MARDQANHPQIRPAFGFTASTTDPMASSGLPHWFFDGTTLFLVSAAGVPAPVGSGGSGNGQLFTARTKTAAVLTGSYVYDNGALGVGATLIRGTNGALGTVGGVTDLAAGEVVLVDQQATPAHNGIYAITTLGSGSVKAKLTRLVGFDTAARMVDGSIMSVKEGTFADQIWQLTATVATVGTSAVTFGQTADVMLLDDAQTVSGAKSFNDAALRIWNAGGTFASHFKTSASDQRDVTFPDATMTVAGINVAQVWPAVQTFAHQIVRVLDATAAFSTRVGSLATTNRDVNFPDRAGTLAVNGSAQSITGPGAVDIVTPTTKIMANAVGNAMTLANGTFTGQRKIATLVSKVGGADTAVITPTALAGGTTITFSNVFDGIELEWNGAAWDVVGYSGLTVIA